MSRDVVQLIESSDDYQPLTQEKAQEILSRPGYFYCERGHARIKKEEYIRRQKGVRRVYGHKIVGRGRYYREVPPECIDCAQGMRIAHGAKGIGHSAKRKTKEKNMEAICKECKKLKKIKARGMCALCYNAWYMRDRHKAGGKSRAERGIDLRRKRPEGVVDHIVQLLAEDEEDAGKGLPLLEHPLAEPGKPKALSLDFTKHLDVYEELERLAEEELRPVEMQAIFLIKEGIGHSAKSIAEDGEE